MEALDAKGDRGVSGGLEDQPRLRGIEGLLEIAEVASEVLGLPERGGVGISGVLARAPVSRPERREELLGDAAASEAQEKPQARPRQAGLGLGLEVVSRRRSAVAIGWAERIGPNREPLQGLGETAVEAVDVPQLVGKDSGQRFGLDQTASEDYRVPANGGGRQRVIENVNTHPAVEAWLMGTQQLERGKKSLALL